MLILYHSNLHLTESSMPTACHYSPTLILVCLVCAFADSALAQAVSPPSWQASTAHTRKTLHRMDELINQADRQAAYKQYLAIFHPEVKAWGLYANGAANIDRVREHYRSVFFELGGGVLVSDKVVVAGPMAAQRYHSLMSLSGTFDGVTAENKPVVIRGQTIFRIDNDGKIRERWSNHDHAYRMGQLLGEPGTSEGTRIARELNGPGLSETETLIRLSALVTAFNQPEAPQQRFSDTTGFLSKTFKLHGVSDRPLDKTGTLQFLEGFWSAFPDTMLDVGTPITAWGHIAVDWRATGTWRQEFRGTINRGAPVCIQGDMILRLSGKGQIEEAWLDAGPALPGHCS